MWVRGNDPTRLHGSCLPVDVLSIKEGKYPSSFGALHSLARCMSEISDGTLRRDADLDFVFVASLDFAQPYLSLPDGWGTQFGVT